MSDFIALYHGSFRFIYTLQECNGACFSSISHKLSSGIPRVAYNVSEISWHISALGAIKFMPRRFLYCLSMVNRFDYRKVTDNTVMIR